MPHDTPNPFPRKTAPAGGLHLVEGTQLLGPWDSTAYEVTPYMIRRVDGQLIQVSRLLFDLAASLDDDTDLEALAARTSTRTGRDLSADNVAHLLATKLLPLGVLATPRTAADAAAGSGPVPLGRPKPLLALRLRRAVIPERVHGRVSTTLAALFRPPLVVTALIALAGGDTWIGVDHGAGVGWGVAGIIAHPALLMLLVAMTVIAAVIHEIGHAAATRAGGATPGVMGAGIYLAWPVFYTDISDSYRLDRSGRLRADLGGVYFNALTVVLATLAYAVTHWALLLVFIVLLHLEVLTQFLPFVRLDGYWVVADLVGVPNLFAYIQPVLAHLIRRSSPADQTRLGELRPRARRVITGWVLATAVVLFVNLAVVAWIGPRLISTTATAAADRARLATLAITHGDVLTALADVVSLAMLVVPAAGIAYIGAQLLLRAARTIRRWWRTRPLAATTLAAGLVALATIQALMFIPAEAPTSSGLQPTPGLTAPQRANGPVVTRPDAASTPPVEAPTLAPTAPRTTPTIGTAQLTSISLDTQTVSASTSAWKHATAPVSHTVDPKATPSPAATTPSSAAVTTPPANPASVAATTAATTITGSVGQAVSGHAPTPTVISANTAGITTATRAVVSTLAATVTGQTAAGIPRSGKPRDTVVAAVHSTNPTVQAVTTVADAALSSLGSHHPKVRSLPPQPRLGLVGQGG